MSLNQDAEENGSGKFNNQQNQSQLTDVALKYVKDISQEKDELSNYPIASKLLELELLNVSSSGRISSRNENFVDIYRQKPLKLSQKVFLPINDFPKFNFVGKILGPGANSLKRLQEETKCKICVLGKNSMRDKQKEDELRNSGDPRYAHLNQQLHVEISTVASPAEAYANIAYALAELRKYIMPDKFDVIRQEQLKELMDGPEGDKHRAKMEANAKKFEHVNQNRNPPQPSGGPYRQDSSSQDDHHHQQQHTQFPVKRSMPHDSGAPIHNSNFKK
ncbi:KHDRBS1.2 family protein [Megaselia abdita]